MDDTLDVKVYRTLVSQAHRSNKVSGPFRLGGRVAFQTVALDLSCFSTKKLEWLHGVVLDVMYVGENQFLLSFIYPLPYQDPVTHRGNRSAAGERYRIHTANVIPGGEVVLRELVMRVAYDAALLSDIQALTEQASRLSAEKAEGKETP